MRRRLVVVGGLVMVSMLWSGCGLSKESARKVVITENVCVGVDFLRLTLGKENRIVLDNSQHGEQQAGMSVFLTEFPASVVGKLPEGAQVGTNFTSLSLTASPGADDSVTVRPLFTGEYSGQCNISVSAAGGGTVLQYELTFQIVDK